MAGLADVARSLLGRGRASRTEGSHQLWVSDYGPEADVIRQVRIENSFLGGVFETPADLPELPFAPIELAAGSDSFSVLTMNADSLAALGAKVEVRGVTG